MPAIKLPRLRLTASSRLYLAFFTCSFVLGSWFAHIPTVQKLANLNRSMLGVGLTGYPLGIFAMLTFGTAIARRLGYRRSFRLAVPGLALAFLVASSAINVAHLFLALFAAGSLHGLMAITGNVEAERLETVTGRQLLVRAHGFYSLATAVAGLMAAAFIEMANKPWVHLGFVFVLSTALIFAATRLATSSLKRDEGQKVVVTVPSRTIILLFLIGGTCLYVDNASTDWSGILLRDEFNASPTIISLTIGIWACGQTAGRFAFPNLSSRIRSDVLLVSMLSLTVVGLLILQISRQLLFTVLAIGCLGLGTSVIYPMTIAMASKLTDRPVSENVAAISQLAFLLAVLTPFIIGKLAELYGIRQAFGSGLAVVAVSLVMAVIFRPLLKRSSDVAGSKRTVRAGSLKKVPRK